MERAGEGIDCKSVNSDQGTERSSLIESSAIYKSALEQQSYPSTVELNRSLYMENTTSSFASLMHVIKGNIGIGMLSLPLAMLKAGTVAGPVLLLAVAIVAIHGMHMLVQCSHAFCDRGGTHLSLDYSGVAEHAIGQYYPNKAYIGRVLVNIFLIITQFGFCCIYLLFVAESLQQACEGLTDLDIKLWILIIILPVVLLTFIHTLKVLAVLSAISNVLAIVGLICVLNYARETVHEPQALPLLTSWSSLPLAFGIIVFTFEGIGVILPVENMMETPRYFRSILSLGMGFVTLLYLLISMLGYLSCQTDCKGSITLNLPNTPFYTSVKLILAGSIFLTYFIQFYVPVGILIPLIQNRLPEHYATWIDCTFRVVMACVTAGLAIGVPQLGNLISLVGSVGSTSLALIFPAAMHMMTFHYNSSLSTLSFFKDIAIITIGILGSIIGFYTTVVDIVNTFEHPTTHNTTSYVM